MKKRRKNKKVENNGKGKIAVWMLITRPASGKVFKKEFVPVFL